MKRILIDKLTPGSEVILRFQGQGDYTEPAIFLGLTGEGEEREARFRSHDGTGPYEWAAYRSDRRWVFGASAERLSVVEAKVDPAT